MLGFVQEYRAETRLDALKQHAGARRSRCCGTGSEQRIPSRELVPGDVMLLEAGDRMPADARLVEVHSLQVRRGAADR